MKQCVLIASTVRPRANVESMSNLIINFEIGTSWNGAAFAAIKFDSK